MHIVPKGTPAQPDQVPELLEQLVTAAPACLYCPDPILAGDMLVAWPIAGIISHFACYAAAQHLVKQPANANGEAVS